MSVRVVCRVACSYDDDLFFEDDDSGTANGLFTSEHTTYVGQVDRSGCPHGMGRFTDDEQRIEYLGEWRAGHWHGWGKLVQVNGDVLEGQWDRGVFSGEGRLSQTEGGIYDGATLPSFFVRLCAALTLVAGCRWFLRGAAGQWKYNRPCGEGRYVLPDGTVYSVSQPLQYIGGLYSCMPAHTRRLTRLPLHWVS